MQDRETNTYWSIMNSSAIKGPLSGSRLTDLPVGIKIQWWDWKKRNPNTRILSVAGIEDAEPGYINYFGSVLGFRGITARDKRLADKEPVFAFEFNGKKYAIAMRAVEGGKQVLIDGISFFFFRPFNADIFYSTLAFFVRNDRFLWKEGSWSTERNQCRFDISNLKFTGDGPDCPRRAGGYDTFWYTWSLVNTNTELIN